MFSVGALHCLSPRESSTEQTTQRYKEESIADTRVAFPGNIIMSKTTPPWNLVTVRGKQASNLSTLVAKKHLDCPFDIKM